MKEQNEMQRTFVMLKPGTLQRRIAGEIISRIERKGFRILAMKMIHLSEDILVKHYAEHRNKSWFKSLEAFMTSGPVIALALAGPNCVLMIRKMSGATMPEEAEPGTIRGDYALGRNISANVIHASDSGESAEREIALFFNEEEIHDWEDPNWDWF